MSFINQLEKKITGKIRKIKNGTESVKDSNVNNLIERLKELDEAAAEELQGKYVEAVKEINNKKD